MLSRDYTSFMLAMGVRDVGRGGVVGGCNTLSREHPGLGLHIRGLAYPPPPPPPPVTPLLPQPCISNGHRTDSHKFGDLLRREGPGGGETYFIP